jgi:signal recognition particle subunit SRP54
MFESLTDKLNLAFKKLKGHGKLTEKNIEAGLKEVRIALLEADVHYKVVKQFLAAIRERAVGQEVLSSLTPGQQVVKIVKEELTRLLGEKLWENNDGRQTCQASGQTTSEALPGSCRYLPPCGH